MGNVRAVAEDDVCACINRCAGKGKRVAAIFTKEQFGGAGNTALRAAFCADMTGYDDDVAFGLGFLHQAADAGEFLHFH